MGHWLSWYLTWAIWLKNEGVVPINLTEKSDIENDVVPPPPLIEPIIFTPRQM